MKPKSTLRSFLALTGSSLLAISSASAADGTWIQTTAGPFDWSAAATANWSGGIVADGQDSTARLTANITAAQTVNLAEARSIGNITFTDSTTDSHNLTISGANVLTLDRSSGIPVINVTQSARTLTVSSEIAGIVGLQKIGAGALALTGSNSYTGDTTISRGTLNLGGATANGSLASTVLNLGGGTLSYTRTGSTTQSFTTTNLNAGASGTTAVAGNTLNLGDVVRSVGATLNIGNTGSITTTDSNTNSILGGWATFNNENWAVANAGPAAITGLGTYTATTNVAADYLNNNMDVGVASTVVGNIDTNSLRFSGPSAKTLTLAAGDNIIQTGGILVRSDVAAFASTISGGNLAGSSGGDLIVHQHNATTALTINSIIKNNGAATGLTKSGGGQLIISGANTFTGNTVINAGQLSVGSNNTGGARLGLATYAGNVSIASGASLVFNSAETQTLSGIISGDGSLQKAGGGTLTLTGNNTYTGKTTVAGVNGGGPTLSVSSFNSVVGGTSSSSIGAPTTVANGTIDLGSGSNVRSCTLTYTGAGETTDRVMNVSFNGGNKHTITSNATGGGLLKFTSNFTINPSSGTSVGGFTLRGSGKGEVAQIGTIPGILDKSDAGTWTVGGTNAANTVTVSGGTLIVNGSLKATNATPSINVNGTSTLGGSGTLTATTAGTAIVTVAAGANLTPGTSVGTLTVDGTLNISALAGAANAGKLNYELDSIAASDKIVVAGTLNIGADLLRFSDFNFTALGGLQDGTYKLITSGAAVSGTLDPILANLTGTVGVGTGTLQISGGGTGNDIELVVSGITGGANYAAWASLNSAGPNLGDDHDNDGVDNGTEYFMFGPSGNSTGFTVLPSVVDNAGTLSVTWTKAGTYTGVYNTNFVVETSDTLVGAWTPEIADPNPGFTVTFPTVTEVKYTFLNPLGTKKFARLKVTGP